ncbi:tetratricopeptide repeat protein [Chitinophaga lutea]
MLFYWWRDYYYIVLILQVIFIAHALKTGRREWLYVLILLPAIGAAFYFFREMLPDIRQGVFLENLQRVFFPNARLNDLERRLRISDTIANRTQLADELAMQRKYQQAISVLEPCLVQRPNDAGIVLAMARLQFQHQQYAPSVELFARILGQKNRLNNPIDELLYAQALEKNGQTQPAEEEYKRIIRVHHSLEARYRYGLLLRAQQRGEEAGAQFQAAVDELELHPRYVRKLHAQWARLSRRELSSLKRR